MPLDNFTIEDDYACFRPTGRFTQKALVPLFEQAMLECKAAQVTRLLINATMLKHPPFSDVGRFEFATAMAEIWDRSVRVAFVLRPDQRDPEGFGVLVGENRGLVAGACTSEEEGLAWLSSRGGTSRSE